LETLVDLRRAAEPLQPGSAVSIPREALLAALEESPAPSAIASNDRTPEAWHTADEAAEKLHALPRWIYDHGDQFGARRLSRRCVRSPQRGVARMRFVDVTRHGSSEILIIKEQVTHVTQIGADVLPENGASS
jgi:hypothetical protein